MHNWYLKAEKSDAEREQEEAERLVRKSPKKKPPRRDKERGRIEVKDDDLTKKDKDLSMNYKDIGGSVALAHAVARKYTQDPENVSIFSKGMREDGSKGPIKGAFLDGVSDMSKYQYDKSSGRRAQYRGKPGPLDAADEYTPPSPEWSLPTSTSDLEMEDYVAIVREARVWLNDSLLTHKVKDEDFDMACRLALDYSIYTASDSKFNGSVGAPSYDRLLGILMRLEGAED